MADLIDDCERFREMIVRSDRSRLMISFQYFPRGSCDDASLLLARFLGEMGHGTFQRMAGQRGSDTHVWLEQGDYVIDITGDQFADCPHPAVYVGRDRSWHADFAGTDSGEANYRLMDGRTVGDLDMTYAQLAK
ncbi:hypothetical protein ACC671_10825 [Rhizobium ruizarguesonis]